jgi:hypothetical protein
MIENGTIPQGDPIASVEEKDGELISATASANY